MTGDNTVLAGILMVVCIMALVWFVTGVSPLIWAVRMLLHLEAIRRQAWASTGAAIRHFCAAYPQAIAEAREEAAASSSQKAEPKGAPQLA